MAWLYYDKTIKVGNGDLQTAAEAVASIFTGIAQAAADSMNSKDSKNNKIKNGIKKSDFQKKNFKTMDVTIGGVSLVQAIFVFIMWVGYNATRG